MTDKEKHTNDVQFQIECLSHDLIEMLMERYGLTMEQAINKLYTSHTYQKIENELTGMYYQSSEYNFCFLEEEFGLHPSFH